MISSEIERDYNVPIPSLSPADVERPREHDRNYPIFSKSCGLHFRGTAFHQSRHIFHLARLHTSILRHIGADQRCGPPEGIYAKDSFRIHNSFKRADHNIRIYEPLLHAVEQAQSTTFHQHRTPELMEKCA
jgi:hypothetical protein